MQTTITGFHRDEVGDWVAELACEHGQHMRHRPPWQLRAWVTTDEGRQQKLGEAIDCPLCDALAMPGAASEYKRTATFTEETLPAALRADHRTKTGTWARIVVEAGALEYHVRGRVHRLEPGQAGLVEPERPHHVRPLGSVHASKSGGGTGGSGNAGGSCGEACTATCTYDGRVHNPGETFPACPADTKLGTGCAECGPVDNCLIVETGCFPICTSTCAVGVCVDGTCHSVCG